jgi:penicillin amidase
VGLESSLDRLIADLNALQAYLPRGGGSNNWVVAGSRTESGKPILASDPHLSPSCPPPWYLAHVRTPEWEIAGAALAGTPGIAIGHNGFCAWGVTAGLTDNSDFFLETLGPDGKSYRQADGTFAPCEVVKEVIRVKDQPDAVEEVHITPRGPILTPVLPDLPLAMSLSAIWLEARPLRGFFGAPRARSFDEFRKHFAEWPCLPLNVLYADTGGAIGWQLVGEVPTRRGGHGLLPRPGDLPDSGWNGTVAFDDMPSVANPECGYLATANDPPTWVKDPTPQPPPPGGEGEHLRETSGVPGALPSAEGCDSPSPPGGGGWGVGSSPWLGADFIDDYRARRIRERLAQRDSGWTPAEVGAIQMDVQSIPWREMRDRVLELTPTNPDAREAISLLARWDGRVESESPAAAVFEFFVAEMCLRVAKAKAPNGWRSAVGEGGMGILGYNLFMDRRVSHLSRLVREQPPGWFASWPAEMESVLADVVRKFRREIGPGSAFWAWGHARPLVLENPLLGKNRWLKGAFNLGPVPWGGDGNTVSQAAVRHADPAVGIHNMANLRAVFDLNDLALSTFVLAGGQSGNPISDHHADQFELWQQGESFVMPWDQASVIRAAVDTLRLIPLGERPA